MVSKDPQGVSNKVFFFWDSFELICRLVFSLGIVQQTQSVQTRAH